MTTQNPDGISAEFLLCRDSPAGQLVLGRTQIAFGDEVVRTCRLDKRIGDPPTHRSALRVVLALAKYKYDDERTFLRADPKWGYFVNSLHKIKNSPKTNWLRRLFGNENRLWSFFDLDQNQARIRASEIHKDRIRVCLARPDGKNWRIDETQNGLSRVILDSLDDRAFSSGQFTLPLDPETRESVMSFATEFLELQGLGTRDSVIVTYSAWHSKLLELRELINDLLDTEGLLETISQEISLRRPSRGWELAPLAGRLAQILKTARRLRKYLAPVNAETTIDGFLASLDQLASMFLDCCIDLDDPQTSALAANEITLTACLKRVHEQATRAKAVVVKAIVARRTEFSKILFPSTSQTPRTGKSLAT